MYTLNVRYDHSQREWRGKGEETADHNTVGTIAGRMVPRRPEKLVEYRRPYCPSLQTVHGSLRLFISADIKKDHWKDVTFSERQNTGLVEKRSTNSVLYRRMKQVLSDICSSSKRQTREALFKWLAYNALVSRNYAMTSETTYVKKKEIEEA